MRCAKFLSGHTGSSTLSNLRNRELKYWPLFMERGRTWVLFASGACRLGFVLFVLLCGPALTTMKLLIIGGTKFLGRHLATDAIARGHEVTLFNRGLHSPEGLQGAETIHGDRNRDLAKLKGRSWDAVVDTCGFLPREIKAAAEVLTDSIGHYTFISSVSVYADVSVPGIDETAPVKRLSAEQLELVNQVDSSGQTSAVNYGAMYGELKALCEQAAEEAMPNRVLNV